MPILLKDILVLLALLNTAIFQIINILMISLDNSLHCTYIHTVCVSLFYIYLYILIFVYLYIYFDK